MRAFAEKVFASETKDENIRDEISMFDVAEDCPILHHEMAQHLHNEDDAEKRWDGQCAFIHFMSRTNWHLMYLNVTLIKQNILRFCIFLSCLKTSYFHVRTMGKKRFQKFWPKMNFQTSPVLYSKRHQRHRTMAVPSAVTQAAATPVVSVEVDTPTYLEVPDFQRVAIIGDYASGVLFPSFVVLN